MFKPYEGILRKQKMSGETLRAYRIYEAIRQRSKRFALPMPTFGAREFIGWWLHNIKCFKGSRPSAGRIDHSKGYSFDNMEMQDMRDNTMEMVARCRPDKMAKRICSKKVSVYLKNTNVVVGQFRSITAAAEFFGKTVSDMANITCGRRNQPKTLKFDLRVAA